MNKPVILLVIGVALFFVSLTADAFGIGEGTGIGWKQITGSVVGLAIAAIGAVQMKKKKT
jgi:hypothetical protein